MQYFLPELNDKMNSHISTEERKRCYRLWDMQLEAYWNAFDLIRDQLSKNLVKNYLNFHDASVKQLVLSKNDTKKRTVTYDIHMIIQSDELYGDMIHQSILEYKNTINSFEDGSMLLEYLYGEILQNTDSSWTHNFLVFGGNEIFIKCKRLLWKDLKRE